MVTVRKTIFHIFSFFLMSTGLVVYPHPRMPGKRRAGKRKVGVWLTEKEESVLKEAARARGFENLADYFRSLIPMDDSTGPITEMIELSPEEHSKATEAVAALGYSLDEFLEITTKRVIEQLVRESNPRTKRKGTKSP